VTRWRAGEADVERLVSVRDLQRVTGSAADGAPGLSRARDTLTSAERLVESDPTNAFVLAYDAARQACTALLAQQGLRPTVTGGHLAVERAVRAQFGTTFADYGRMRRRRHEVEYPAHADERVDRDEALDALTRAGELIDAATKVMPHLGLFEG